MKKIKIGFLDSGLGGITVLKEAMKSVKADYIYYGDNKNSPYGIKEKEIVKKYVFNAVEVLIQKGCTIVVIACNTATSIAVDELRRKYKNICIIGTEPAIKVAFDSKNFTKAIICATTLTLKEEKLNNLIKRLNIVDNVDKLALDDLVKFIENGNYIKSDEITKYLKQKFEKFDLERYSHVVLGCTHFPILKEYFELILPKDVKIVDGNKGISLNIKKHVEENNKDYFENFEFYNSIKSSVSLITTKNSKTFIDNFRRISQIQEFDVEVI